MCHSHTACVYSEWEKGRGDVRHEAEAGVDTQSLSFTHIGGVYESFLSGGVVSGLVISLLLEKSKVLCQMVEKNLQNDSEQTVAPLKHDSTVLDSTIVRKSPLW